MKTSALAGKPAPAGILVNVPRLVTAYYWRRAHRDWRIWFCVIVMLFAMLVYIATGGLRWRISGQPQQSPQPISVPAGN
jgi:hypothetical protein